MLEITNFIERSTKKKKLSNNSNNGDEEAKRLRAGNLAVFVLETPTSPGSAFEEILKSEV